jgi:ABC-type dipeptide/oligopeptide/nickel transport system ATPase subunit
MSQLATTRPSEPLLRLEQLDRCFLSGEQEVAVLKSLWLTIHAGEMVAIVGASGSGKSTLMNILGCLDRPTRGDYRISGRSTREMGEHRAHPAECGLGTHLFYRVWKVFNTLISTWLFLGFESCTYKSVLIRSRPGLCVA